MTDSIFGLSEQYCFLSPHSLQTHIMGVIWPISDGTYSHARWERIGHYSIGCKGEELVPFWGALRVNPPWFNKELENVEPSSDTPWMEPLLPAQQPSFWNPVLSPISITNLMHCSFKQGPWGSFLVPESPQLHPFVKKLKGKFTWKWMSLERRFRTYNNGCFSVVFFWVFFYCCGW